MLWVYCQRREATGLRGSTKDSHWSEHTFRGELLTVILHDDISTLQKVFPLAHNPVTSMPFSARRKICRLSRHSGLMSRWHHTPVRQEGHSHPAQMTHDTRIFVALRLMADVTKFDVPSASATAVSYGYGAVRTWSSLRQLGLYITSAIATVWQIILFGTSCDHGLHRRKKGCCIR